MIRDHILGWGNTNNGELICMNGALYILSVLVRKILLWALSLQNSKINNGLDDNGFILNEYCVGNIQPEFGTVVNGVIEALLTTFPNDIKSIYLYGSVVRGNAFLGKSDLDVSVIFNRPLTSDDFEAMRSLSITMRNCYPEVSKVDIDPGDIDSILKEQEYYRWQFWFKHCCCCVWGEDIAVNFAKHKPSIQIAYALNSDMANFVEDTLPQFEALQANDICKIIGKRLIRAAYYLIAEQNNTWHTNLSSCYTSALPYYPDNKHDLQQAYELAQGISVNSDDAIKLYTSFSHHLLCSNKA